MTTLDKILSIDRRFLYLAVALAVIIPLLNPIGLPINVTPPAQNVFDAVDAIPSGGTILIAMDFDPSSKPELYPMSLAVLRHCFAKDLKVVIVTLWVTGVGLAENAVAKTSAEFDKKTGVDYAYLGYRPGGAFLIQRLGDSITDIYSDDYYGADTSEMPIFKEVNSLGQLDYMVDLAAGATVEWWIAYGSEKFKFDMAAGCTAVSAAQYYPFLDTGQIEGLLGGLKGAAEYEKMIVEAGYFDKPGYATMGMDAQSIVHLMIVIIVIFTNIIYFIQRKQPKEES